MKFKCLFNLLALFLILTSGIPIASTQSYLYRFVNTGTEGNVSFVKNDSVGFIYIGGDFYNEELSFGSSTVYAPSSGESNNLFLLKTNPNGKTVWMHSIYGVEDETHYPYLNLSGLDNNNAGELAAAFSAYGTETVVAGRHKVALNYPDGYTNILITKISIEGYILWLNQIIVIAEQPDGKISDIKIDEDGAVIVTGQFYGDSATFENTTISGYYSTYTVFTAKYYSDGSLAWVKKLNTVSNEETYVDMNSQKIDSDIKNRVFIAGDFYGNGGVAILNDTIYANGTTNGFLLCYDESGNELWGKTYIGDSNDFVNDIIVDDNLSVTVLGYSSSGKLSIDAETYAKTSGTDAFIVRYDSDGNLEWLTQVNVQLESTTDLYINTLFGLDLDANVYMCGLFNSDQLLGLEDNSGTETSDIFAAKFNSADGSVAWTFSAGSADYEEISFGDIDNHGNISFGGYFSTDFTIGSIPLSIGTSYNNYFYANIHNSGTLLFAKKIAGTSGGLYVNDISRDYYGNVSIIGEFYGADNYLDDFQLVNDNNNGIFLARYSRVFNLSGVVKDVYGDVVPEGLVRVLGYSYRQRSPVSDSTEILTDGTFIIEDIPLGRYIVQVEPYNNGEKQYLPGYYPSAGTWEDASQIAVTAFTTIDDIEIIIPVYETLSGNNRLQGLANEIDSNDVFKSTMKKPMSSGRASLARSKDKSTEYEIIATAETDDEGGFEFYSVPNGGYTLLFEVPGLPNVDPHSVTVTGGMFVSNLNYYISETEVQGEGDAYYSSIDDIDEDDIFIIYPNPVEKTLRYCSDNYLNVNNIKITDNIGRLVYYKNNPPQEIEVSNLPSGIYYIEFSTTDKSSSLKFIKE